MNIYQIGQQVKVAYMQAADVEGYNREGVITEVRPFEEYMVHITDEPKVPDLLVCDDDIAPLEDK